MRKRAFFFVSQSNPQLQVQYVVRPMAPMNKYCIELEKTPIEMLQKRSSFLRPLSLPPAGTKQWKEPQATTAMKMVPIYVLYTISTKMKASLHGTKIGNQKEIICLDGCLTFWLPGVLVDRVTAIYANTIANQLSSSYRVN